MRKRALFVGPTGSGKSTLINVLFNNDVQKESMSVPAIADDTSLGVTSVFTTYYDFPNSFAYTDSIGFGDSKFDQTEIFHQLKCIIKQSMVGYKRIYLCLKYGRMSQEIRYYIEFLVTIFDKGILKYCTIIFTHCKDESMTKVKFLEKNKNDQDLCALVNKVSNIIFGDNNTDENETIEKVLLDRRKNLLDQIKTDLASSSTDYYIPRPTDVYEWIKRIGLIFKRLIMDVYGNSVFKLASSLVITHGEIQKLEKLFRQEDPAKYLDYYGECPICTDSMWSTDAIITKCHHAFHIKCLQKLTNPVCPVCNGTIDLPPKND